MAKFAKFTTLMENPFKFNCVTTIWFGALPADLISKIENYGWRSNKLN